MPAAYDGWAVLHAQHSSVTPSAPESSGSRHPSPHPILPPSAPLQIVFSSTLLHGNFMTIEHRRYMAMRVVEEANRWRGYNA